MAATSAKSAGARDDRAHAGAAPEGPVVVHVKDARSGDMDVFAGTQQARLRDPALAARLMRAVR